MRIYSKMHFSQKAAYIDLRNTLYIWLWKIISQKTMIMMRIANDSLVDSFVSVRKFFTGQRLYFVSDIIDKKGLP